MLSTADGRRSIFLSFRCLAFPDSKKLPIYRWVDREFSSRRVDSETRARSHCLPATFYTITERP